MCEDARRDEIDNIEPCDRQPGSGLTEFKHRTRFANGWLAFVYARLFGAPKRTVYIHEEKSSC